MTSQSRVDVLIPTCNRPAALAVTLTALFAQNFPSLRVVVSDQGEAEACAAGEVRAMARLLASRGVAIELHRHLPRRGLAEQRDFLLGRAAAQYVLFLDDDVVLEPDLIARMVRALRRAGCGFVGSALHGLSFRDDRRPHEEAIEFWEDGVVPETIEPDGPQWARHRLHNAANLYHVQERLALRAGTQKYYRIAWIGGCVLYDAEKLRDSGGFGFWRELPPEHSGEDVLAQLRVMARHGGCGLIPSGAYHLELPTTVPHRDIDAPKYLRAHALREPEEVQA